MTTLTKQAGMAPTRKWKSGAWTGGAMAVIFGLIAIFFPEAYTRVPPGMEGGAAIVLAKAVEYWTLERK